MRIDSKPSSDPGGDWDRLTRWRYDRLRNAGFPVELADRLGHDRSTDLHALLDLMDRGCPPSLAARILAPIDKEPDT